MALIRSASKTARSKNIKTEIAAGKPPKQAVAIGYAVQRKAKAKGKDIARGKRVASRIDTGMMFINNISCADAEVPFGGIKDSGYGRELGDMGIKGFVNKKLVRVASMDAPA